MKKTILFFDRCDLTRLFILLTKELDQEYNVIHVAFSSIEAAKLEQAGIKNYYSLDEELSNVMNSQLLDMSIIDDIDKFILNISKGVFNVNAAIQADRGFTLLDNKEALLLAQSYYLAWKKIFSMYHVDLMFHEPSSLFMVYMAALMCKSQGGNFYYMQQSPSDSNDFTYMFLDGENYLCPEFEDLYNYYLNNPGKIDQKRVEAYINTFSADTSVFMGNLHNATIPKYKIRLKSLKYCLIRFIYGSRYDKLKNNIDYWMVKENNTNAERLYNIKNYRFRKITFLTSLPEGEKYYYYPLHLEPEATVTYLGEGLYTNQVKLIENIAASIPPGYYLYVKDHPHEYAYRSAEDYYRLMKVPNIRLIHQSIPGKLLVKQSEGVFTINGTAGFEALMMGKKVYCFAKNYYSFFEWVHYIPNIKDARGIVYSDKAKDEKDVIKYNAFVYAYLRSNHPGFVAYFDLDVESELDEQNNAKQISDSIRNL